MPAPETSDGARVSTSVQNSAVQSSVVRMSGLPNVGTLKGASQSTQFSSSLEHELEELIGTGLDESVNGVCVNFSIEDHSSHNQNVHGAHRPLTAKESELSDSDLLAAFAKCEEVVAVDAGSRMACWEAMPEDSAEKIHLKRKWGEIATTSSEACWDLMPED